MSSGASTKGTKALGTARSAVDRSPRLQSASRKISRQGPPAILSMPASHRFGRPVRSTAAHSRLILTCTPMASALPCSRPVAPEKPPRWTKQSLSSVSSRSLGAKSRLAKIDAAHTMPLDWNTRELYEGLHCFHSRAFFEAHEHWETVWLAAQQRERRFCRGSFRSLLGSTTFSAATVREPFRC